MTMPVGLDAWNAGENYETYMGRWSRRIAARFLTWLAPPPQADWLEVGCGTGALTESILAVSAPRLILSIDPSEGFVAYARKSITDPRVRFEVAGAQALPVPDSRIDVVASGLVLNFIPDRDAALQEMQRVLRPQGRLAFYVWDYPGGGMGFIDAFWKAAAAIDRDGKRLEETQRFSFCTPDGLTALCREAGLRDIDLASIEIEAVFPDFAAFWHPFTLGTGPAPAYCASLPDAQRTALKARLAADLDSGGPIRLPARAWAVKARAKD